MQTTEQIKQDIINQFTWDSRIDASQIKVVVSNDNQVILEGAVPTYHQKHVAQQVAQAIPGVRQISNQLTVKPSQGISEPTDAEIQHHTQKLLDWHAEIDANHIDVTVESGISTLSGSVPTFWEKKQAERQAGRASGVVDVVNQLVVAPEATIADELLGQRILDRIQRNTTLQAEDIEIKVNQGKVSLFGEVNSWDTWRNVYDTTQYTSGVTHIDDNLIVDNLP